MAPARSLTNSDYARLLAVRTRLRAFEQWSARQAAGRGLSAAQHQLMLVIRGYTGGVGPTIGQAANYLMIRPNTAVELVDRTQRQGLISRNADPDDHRMVRLTLTAEGHERLRDLSAAHISELARLRPLIDALINDLDAQSTRTSGAQPHARRDEPRPSRSQAHTSSQPQPRTLGEEA